MLTATYQLLEELNCIPAAQNTKLLGGTPQIRRRGGGRADSTWRFPTLTRCRASSAGNLTLGDVV